MIFETIIEETKDSIKSAILMKPTAGVSSVLMIDDPSNKNSKSNNSLLLEKLKAAKQLRHLHLLNLHH